MTNPSQPAELAGHPIVLTWPVQWGDQDAFGHVNNVVYFRWMESARIAYFRQAAVPSSQGGQGTGPILASVKCDFRRQLTYPDTVLISASVASFGRTSMRMVHRVYSTAQQAIAAEGDSTIVMFDYTAQRSVVVSDEIRARIDALEGRAPGGT
jgi:acyl-CoA thioester hydrolase